MVNENAKRLATGTYGPITITFTSTSTGEGTQTRTATLTVGAPSLQVTPTTNIAASGTQGGPFSPSFFSYTLSSTSGSVNYSISAPVAHRICSSGRCYSRTNDRDVHVK
jgi:hypothetical protein